LQTSNKSRKKLHDNITAKTTIASVTKAIRMEAHKKLKQMGTMQTAKMAILIVS